MSAPALTKRKSRGAASSYEYEHDPKPKSKGTTASMLHQQDYLKANKKGAKCTAAQQQTFQQQAAEQWKTLPGVSKAPYLDEAQKLQNIADRNVQEWKVRLQRQCLVICQSEDERGVKEALPSCKHDYQGVSTAMQLEGWCVRPHLNVETASELQEIFEDFMEGQFSQVRRFGRMHLCVRVWRRLLISCARAHGRMPTHLRLTVMHM